MEEDWEDDYKECTEFGPFFQLVEAGGKDWPQGLVYREGRMYQEGFLLIPEGLVGRVMRALHSQFGHPGGPRLMVRCQMYVSISGRKKKRRDSPKP